MKQSLHLQQIVQYISFSRFAFSLYVQFLTKKTVFFFFLYIYTEKDGTFDFNIYKKR